MVTLTQPEYERTPAPSLFPTLLLTTVLNRGLISSWRPLVSNIKTIWPNAPGRRSPARLAPYWFMPVYRIRFGITPLLIVLTSSMFCLCGAFAVTILTFQLPPTNSFSVRNHESAIFVPSDALLSYVNGRVQIIPMVNKPSAGSEASSLG
jgi:hypothetical protein